MPTTYIRKKRQPQEKPDSIRVYVPRWVDPFPWIQGSSIEKMVLAEFVRRGIYFIHTPQTNSLGGLVDPTWEPDFLLPQYHIWIEIQGAYFHTLPGAVEADSLRFAVIEAAGWKPIFWWEDDIRTRLFEIMDAVPEFYRVNSALQTGWQYSSVGKGAAPKDWWSINDTGVGAGNLPFLEGGTNIDHLAGLRKALAGRARPPQGLKVRRRTKRRPK